MGTELAVLRRGLGDQPDRATQWRRPRPGLRDAHGVGARIDLAERRLVDPGCDLDKAHGAGLEIRPDDDRARRIEVARRAVGLDALDMEPRRRAGRLERPLDAAGLLARERP